MKVIATVTAAALLGSAGTAAMGQAATQSSPDPSAASSPHQRQATGSGAEESPATNGADPGTASSPHQHQAMQDVSKADTDTAMAAGATPATFVKTAAEDGMTEVALARLALSKSSNDDVKQFAQKMSQDHGKADSQLAALAKAKGLTAPTHLDARHEAMVKALGAKSGAAFDSAYAMHMAKDHTKAIALFQSAAQSSDPELAAFARQTLPTLQEHKQMADNLRASTATRTASAGSAK